MTARQSVLVGIVAFLLGVVSGVPHTRWRDPYIEADEKRYTDYLERVVRPTLVYKSGSRVTSLEQELPDDLWRLESEDRPPWPRKRVKCYEKGTGRPLVWTCTYQP